MTKGFTCPHCNTKDNVDVTQTYPQDNKKRRRYQCMSCHGRFTTVESMEPVRELFVRRAALSSPWGILKTESNV